ncbi:ABC transporter substrate-binding protein [Marinomonas mediterranea]|uniref:Extracellular solute-binding protein family 1 n=1 Tax=Marinomonas mediterranea (strain ATCC 700492 / JCM 21426 / NBRC 103028 / MMB-1) TaxID=717774 RepID=F2K0A8_MARM1|nr:ABC transporter substrate-binding protein [Marinomonas mediterranea]ADZ89823.1 extracellular solute-binding protein family 1 [Marinomonas mediterranea MMB-1]WCN16044.1 extracellular solute-binding protein [Marinomonas mediterranea MMB-1]
MKKIKKIMSFVVVGGSVLSASYAPADELRMSWWGGNSRHEATNAAVDEFEKKYPNISVKTEYTGWGGHLERLTTQIAGNTAPDVMQTNWNWLPIFSKNGDGYQDLTDYSDIIDFSQFPESALKAGQRNGVQNGIPISMAARIFYYNKDTWARAGLDFPTNWGELMASGAVFKEKLGEKYFPMVLEGRDVMAMNRSYMIQKYGVPFIDEASKRIAYSEEQMVEFFQLYADMVTQHVVPSSKYIAAFGAANLYEHKPWINGEWAGVYMWNSAINKYNDNLKPPMSMALGPYLIKSGASDAGLFYKPAQMFAIGNNTNYPEDSAALINFLLNDPQGFRAMGLKRGVPLSKIARETLVADGVIKNKDLSVAGLNYIDVLPKNSSVSQYFENPKLLGLFEEMLQDMDHGNKTVEEAADTFLKKSKRILRKAMK